MPAPNEGTPLKGAAAEEPKPKRRELSSPVHAFVNELKCLIGVGSLTLPYASVQVGLLASLVGVLVLCYLAWEGIRLFIYCAAHELRRERHGIDLLGGGTHDDVHGSSWRRVSEAAFGRVGWIVTFTSLLLAQVV